MHCQTIRKKSAARHTHTQDQNIKICSTYIIIKHHKTMLQFCKPGAKTLRLNTRCYELTPGPSIRFYPKLQGNHHQILPKIVMLNPIQWGKHKSTPLSKNGKHLFWTSLHFFWSWTLFINLTTILLKKATLLLGLRTLLLDLALPQTTPPVDRFSKLRLDRTSSSSRGPELRYHATWQEAFQYIVWFSASFRFCPLLTSYFSHLFRPFSFMQELNLVSTSVTVPHLGTFIWLQYLNFAPFASHQTSYISCIHWASNIYTSPLASLQLLAFIMVQYLKFPPQCPSTTYCIWLHMWHPRGPVSTSNFPFPLCAPQLPASISLHT